MYPLGLGLVLIKYFLFLCIVVLVIWIFFFFLDMIYVWPKDDACVLQHFSVGFEFTFGGFWVFLQLCK